MGRAGVGTTFDANRGAEIISAENYLRPFSLPTKKKTPTMGKAAATASRARTRAG